MPLGARVNIGILAKDIDTKEKVENMMKPIISGWSENTINTNKQRRDLQSLAKRVEAIELIFNGGKGKNYIWDNLTDKITEEVSFFLF